MSAADVMTPDPVCISPDASITDAVSRLKSRLILSGLFARARNARSAGYQNQ